MKLKEILRSFLRKMDAENTVDYICGTEALPLPLSPEEESEMLGKLEQGEETDKVKAELIQHNLRLVVYIARKFDNTGVDPDDLISVGTIGLIKAINSFRPDKNIKLATYASRCIENEILMYLRRTVRLKSEVSFDEPLNTDFEGNELLLSDILGTSAESVYGGAGIERGKGAAQGGAQKAYRAGEEDHVSSLRAERGRGDDAKGRGGPSGHFPKLYFAAGKEDYPKAAQRDRENGIRRSARPCRPYLQKIFPTDK